MSPVPVKKRADLSSWEVEGEAVIYDPSSGMGYILNPTALRIWSLCDGRNTNADIANALAGDFPGQKDRIFEDVDEAVRQLAQLGLAEAA